MQEHIPLGSMNIQVTFMQWCDDRESSFFVFLCVCLYVYLPACHVGAYFCDIAIAGARNRGGACPLTPSLPISFSAKKGPPMAYLLVRCALASIGIFSDLCGQTLLFFLPACPPLQKMALVPFTFPFQSLTSWQAVRDLSRHQLTKHLPLFFSLLGLSLLHLPLLPSLVCLYMYIAPVHLPKTSSLFFYFLGGLRRTKGSTLCSFCKHFKVVRLHPLSSVLFS